MTSNPKGGAPEGNVNARVHGGRSSQPELVVGCWGSRHQHAVRGTLAFRRWLMAQCVAAHGRVGPSHAGNIQRATTANMAQRVIRSILARAKPGELSAGEEADLVGRVMHYSAEEQRAVNKLDLDTEPRNEWDELDRQQAMEDVQEAAESDPDEDGQDDALAGETSPDGTAIDEAVDGDIRAEWDELDAANAAEREADSAPPV